MGANWMSQGERETYACQFQNFRSKVFENSGNIDGSLGTDAHLVLSVLLQETLHTTTGELRRIR